MVGQFFARKPLALLLEEMTGEQGLRRIPGPVTLTSLGVGAIIGAGIFVSTGAKARQTSGPILYGVSPAGSLATETETTAEGLPGTERK